MNICGNLWNLVLFCGYDSKKWCPLLWFWQYWYLIFFNKLVNFVSGFIYTFIFTFNGNCSVDDKYIFKQWMGKYISYWKLCAFFLITHCFIIVLACNGSFVWATISVYQQHSNKNNIWSHRDCFVTRNIILLKNKKTCSGVVKSYLWKAKYRAYIFVFDTKIQIEFSA